MDRIDNAYQIYQVSISDYRSAYDDYVLARSQYISFGSLQAEKEARDKTSNFLQARDQLVVNYLSLLKIELEEAAGINETRKIDLLAKIDNQMFWFSDHKSSTASTFTLDQLIQHSDSAKTQYDLAKEVAFEVLSEVSFGKVEIYIKRFDEIFETTKNKLTDIKSDERADYQLSNRQKELVEKWVLETETRRNRAEETITNARENVEKKGFKGGSERALAVYNEALGQLSLVVKHLDEGGRFIQEIVRIVKTKN